MKSRVISALILSALLVTVIAFSDIKIIFNIFIAAISAAALYEVLIVTKYIESKSLIVISLVFAVCIPFIHFMPQLTRGAFILGIFSYAMILFVTLLISYRIFSLEHLSVVFLMSTIIPLFFSTLLYSRELEFGLYNILFIFLCSWGTDTGGYIFGKLFGRHKLTPKISPKKTVEGALGGILSSITACTCLCYAIDIFDPTVVVDYTALVIYSFIGSVFAILGDLIASIIKRNFNVKDFGKMIPGHGGIMDRFDSVLFSSPMLYMMLVLSAIFKIKG